MTLVDDFVAIAEESTYGTAAALSRGVLCNPEEFNMTEVMDTIPSTTRIPGQLLESVTLARAFMGASGAGALEALDKGMGLLFKHGLGGFASATHPVEGTMKRMTFTPNATSKYGLSLTMQLYKAYKNTLGKAFTYLGVKVVGIKFMCDVGGTVKVSLTFDGRDVANSGDTISGTLSSGSSNVTVASTVGLSPGMPISGTGIPASSYIRGITSATVFTLGDAAGASVNASASGAQTLTYSRGAPIAAVSSPTYSSSAQPFVWSDVALTVDGVAACATGWEVSYEFTMDLARRFQCNNGLKDEPVVVDISKATVSLKGMEWLAPTSTGQHQEYNRYMGLTPGASIAAFVATASTRLPAAGVTKGQLQLSAPTILATSGVPDMKAAQPAEFKILGTPGLTVVYDTLDATP